LPRVLTDRSVSTAYRLRPTAHRRRPAV